MSLMPDCTCRKDFGYVFGDYSAECPRHASVAKWLKEKRERLAAELNGLHEQAMTRPVHGGYPEFISSKERER
jgi:hypothetical protein